MTVAVRSYSFSPLAEAYGYVGQTAEGLRARAEALAVAHTTGHTMRVGGRLLTGTVTCHGGCGRSSIDHRGGGASRPVRELQGAQAPSEGCKLGQ